MTLSKKEKSVTGRKSLFDLLVTVSQFRKYSGKMPTEHFDSMQVQDRIFLHCTRSLTSSLLQVQLFGFRSLMIINRNHG